MLSYAVVLLFFTERGRVELITRTTVDFYVSVNYEQSCGSSRRIPSAIVSSCHTNYCFFCRHRSNGIQEFSESHFSWKLIFSFLPSHKDSQ